MKTYDNYRYYARTYGWSREKYLEQKRRQDEYVKNARIVSARDKDTCRYCGSKDHPSIDHIVPLVQGGGNELENLVIACRRCNSVKGGRTPEQAGMKILPLVRVEDNT